MTSPQQIVVVGVTGEMGKPIVKKLISLGYCVIGVARNTEALHALGCDLNAGHLFIPCASDISEDTASNAIAQCVTMSVKAVIHAAGVPTAGGVLTAPTEALVKAMNIKVAGMLRLVRAVDDKLGIDARLIAIGGHYGFEPTAYAATAGVANAALTNLIKQLSWAYGPRKVTAHLLAPGPAETPRLERVAQAKAELQGTSKDSVLDEMKAESALSEFTRVEDVVWGIELLLSPHARALAGSVLFMDAGRRRGIP